MRQIGEIHAKFEPTRALRKSLFCATPSCPYYSSWEILDFGSLNCGISRHALRTRRSGKQCSRGEIQAQNQALILHVHMVLCNFPPAAHSQRLREEAFCVDEVQRDPLAGIIRGRQ